MEAEHWWERAKREMKAGWDEAGRRDAWLLRWVLPVVISVQFLYSIAFAPRWTELSVRQAAEVRRVTATGAVLLIVGWCWGYRVGRRDRDRM